MNYKHRDVDFIKVNEDQYIAIACDSCGAIGLKEHDIVKVPYSITGKYTTRVGLMEVLSIGAKPVALTANICNEPNPTGEEILDGIRNELSEASLDVQLTISTEKNTETSMTALGITVIGIVDKDDILLNKISPGNYIYAVGIPSIGNEVIQNEASIANIKMLQELLKNKSINEAIPVGSCGINGELDKLSEAYDMKIDYTDDIHIDIHKSAGPCTVIIVVSKEKIEHLFDIPINFIGKIA
ncbi:hypothetical protein R9X47_20385 [Wukongibacter baidiensis]|uniref:AIR synthase related protein n=1 Tax=Wukongibacter baidiensis TaxID=1723361 RepID=UPI003D7F5B0C